MVEISLTQGNFNVQYWKEKERKRKGTRRVRRVEGAEQWERKRKEGEETAGAGRKGKVMESKKEGKGQI